MTDKTQKPDDLGALALQAAQLESEAQAQQTAGPGGEQQQEEPSLQTNAEIIAGTLMLARDTACMAFELSSPAAVLTDQKAEKLGEMWGRVADKYGWNLAGALGDYKEEIVAFMGTVGIARELAKAVVMEMDAKAKAHFDRTVDAATPPAAPEPA